MSPGGSYKRCPACGESAAPDAVFCARCGHGYRTPPQPGNQTQYYQGPGYPVRGGADSTKLIVALLLWFLLPMLGVHRMYLGHVGSGVAMLALTLVGAMTSCLVVGIFPLAVAAIWWFVDVFLMVTGALRPTDGTSLV